jgi:TusE/DsrC/DsvC family sulfur relay protein
MGIERDDNGYLVNPGEWNSDIMYEMAEQDDFNMTPEIRKQVMSARAYYDEYSSVPPIRTFSKYYGKGKKELFMDHGGSGPMKNLSKYGGLPQPRGCV